MKSYLANNKVTPLNSFSNLTFYETFASSRWTWKSIKKNLSTTEKNNDFVKPQIWKWLMRCVWSSGVFQIAFILKARPLCSLCLLMHCCLHQCRTCHFISSPTCRFWGLLQFSPHHFSSSLCSSIRIRSVAKHVTCRNRFKCEWKKALFLH